MLWFFNIVGTVIAFIKDKFGIKTVFKSDIVSYLQSQDNESFEVISAMDVIEHFRKEEIIDLLKLIYNPHFQTNMCSWILNAPVKHYNKNKNYDTIFELLYDLNTGNMTKIEANGATRKYIIQRPGFDSLIRKILNKNLEIKISPEFLNKTFGKDFIPKMKFRNYLKFSYNFKKYRFRPEQDTWYASKHIAGIQCYLVIDSSGKVHPYGLDSMEYKTFWKLVNEIEKLGFKNIVIEGIASAINPDGTSNLKQICADKRLRHYNIKNILFTATDMFTLDEYNSGKSNRMLNERLSILDETFRPFYNLDYFRVAKRVKISGSQHMYSLMRSALSDGISDGLFLQRNSTYSYNRDFDCVLADDFKSVNLNIRLVSPNNKDYLYYTDENGATCELGDDITKYTPKIVNKQSLHEFKCKYKDGHAFVPNGFSLNERDEFFKNKNLYINKTIKVYYLDEEKDSKNRCTLTNTIFGGFV